MSEDYTYQPTAYVTIRREELEALRQSITDIEALLVAAQKSVVELEALTGYYGADQWRRGYAGKDPQEYDEWKKRKNL